MKYTASDIKNILNTHIKVCEYNSTLTQVAIDSRRIILPEETIFFALEGTRSDGHDFVAELTELGVKNFVVCKEMNVQGVNQYIVSNTQQALQKLAEYHRKGLTFPIIGVTGSNGKTIVKEWLSSLLEEDYNVVKTPKSYNSQIGVPLSLLKAEKNHTIGIFEAGISQKGEMRNIVQVLNPTIGVFTNLGGAHSEGFSSSTEKLKEKLLLFNNAQTIIYSTENKLVAQTIQEAYRDRRLLSWGKSEGDVVQVSDSEKGSLSLVYEEISYTFKLPFVDKASVENIIHCIVVALYLEVSSKKIQAGIDELSQLPMRLEFKEGINNNVLVNDAYNNDVEGLEVSLDFLLQQHTKGKVVLILSDILQSGKDEKELYEFVSNMVTQKGVDKIIGIGSDIAKNESLFKIDKSFYPSTEAFIDSPEMEGIHNASILLKGAREFTFENVANILSNRIHRTVLEVNLEALIHNLNVYKSKLKPTTKILVMVKAFAYGAGNLEIAKVLEYNGVGYLGVAYADEGVMLRRQGVSIPILVMNPDKDAYPIILKYDLEPEVYSLTELKALISVAKNEKIKVHIKLDTGMHRLGFESIDQLCEVLLENRNLEVKSIFSHLAGADEDQFDVFTKHQIEEFESMYNQLVETLEYTPLKHILNSAGIIKFPEAQFDMVRLGIGLYGIEASGKHQDELEQISTFKTVISQIRTVNPGETIGYSRKGKSKNAMQVATIAVGYADGYSRAFSNGVGEVLVNGVSAPIVGNVCMDMCMVNVTGIEVKEGDEVILFGKDLPVYELAKKINTIPYEILTNVSERVKRVFYN